MDIPQHSGSFAGQRGFPSTGAFPRCSRQMEDAVLDVYDLVYDQAVRSSPSIRRQELAAIQDTVSMGGSRPHRVFWAGQPPRMNCDPENGTGWPPRVSWH